MVKEPEAICTLRAIDLTDIEDLDALGLRLLYSWFSERDYALGISRVDALISPISVPLTLRSFVEEARQCYALSQYNAVYSLSRTILEIAVNDICIRIGRMPKRILDEDLFDEEGYSFRRRLSFLSSGPRFNRVHDHYKILCRVVHGGATVHGSEALAALTETLGFTHCFYAVHRHAMRSEV